MINWFYWIVHLTKDQRFQLLEPQDFFWNHSLLKYNELIEFDGTVLLGYPAYNFTFSSNKFNHTLHNQPSKKDLSLQVCTTAAESSLPDLNWHYKPQNLPIGLPKY